MRGMRCVEAGARPVDRIPCIDYDGGAQKQGGEKYLFLTRREYGLETCFLCF